MTTGPKLTKQECPSCATRSRCVLSVVEPEVLGDPALGIHWARFEEGGTIVHEGAPSVGWVILCRGQAKLTLSTDHGKRVLLRCCGPGELLSGPLSGTHAFSAAALSPSVVAFAARESVLALGRRYPDMLLKAHRRLEERQGHLARRLVDCVYGSARRRLVRVLLELGEEHGAPERGGVRIDVPLSLRDLAEMIGASRQTTSEEIQKLARQGLVKAAWPTLWVLDSDGLRRHR